MGGYEPTYIKGFEGGLVQDRENFILPNDAYPVLENAYVWRERLIRKQGCQLLGRLRRTFDNKSLGTSPASPWTFNILVESGYVVAANNLSPGKVTTKYAHNLKDGDVVVISEVEGAIGYNNVAFTIMVTSDTEFTVGVDAALFGVYASGGFFFSNRSLLGTGTEPDAQVQLGSVVINVNPIFTTGMISGYTNSSDCVVNAVAHGLSTGDDISISGVIIEDGTGDNEINGGPYIITVIDADHFSLGVSSETWGIYSSGGTWTFVTASAQQLVDQGDGTLISDPLTATGTINYITGEIVITGATAGVNTVIDYNYFPGLPVMGLRPRQLNNINQQQVIAFDTKYAYKYLGGWEEFVPGYVWSGNDSDFFWSTNYWQNAANNRYFWVTNFSSNDQIRYTEGGSTWTDFKPLITVAGSLYLQKALCMLPFRGRLVAFNTFEGDTIQTSVQYPQRIRWSAIGNPIPNPGAMPPYEPWISDVRGKGGFLDIPTSESIISVGFVRDNCVIYCEYSTWQLRYTGRSISPFQIERVNSELGAQSTFSSVQFDTSLVGIGDKGVVECDSYKSERIDIKIPDLVYQFQDDANGVKRVHGIRDFAKRLAYWTFPLKYTNRNNTILKYPNRRLVYNYENDSWAIFTDSLTTLGTYQPQNSRRWRELNQPFIDTWENSNYTWIDKPSLAPIIIGGNQQGYVEQLDRQVTNDRSLSIYNIEGRMDTGMPTVITSPEHNLYYSTDTPGDYDVIKIVGIPEGNDFDYLNGQVFGVIPVDENSFTIYKYDPMTQGFTNPQIDANALTYIGGGELCVVEGFSIVSKKFNYLDDGQNIQLGYIDILMNKTDNGAISLNVYLDYNNNEPINILPQNAYIDTFFNSVVQTSIIGGLPGSKYWQRIFCPSRGAFLTIEWTLSNAQLAGDEVNQDVQIDAQILWMRKSGRQLPVGI